MVIDSSALIAITLDEPDRDTYFDAIVDASTRKMSAASVIEAVEIYVRVLQVPDPAAALLRDLTKLNITVVGINGEQTHLALDARVKYGKGRHRAALNFGDCFSYALARYLGEPLLFKGDDFAHTDVARVL